MHLCTHQISLKLEELFVDGRMYGRMYVPTDGQTFLL